METRESPSTGFGWPWFALTVAFALHVVDEALTGNARWLRPLAWFYAVIMLLNSLGHTLVTILGHTVAMVSVPRPAPGFYSSPLLFIGSLWMISRLVKTSRIRLALMAT